MAHATRRFVPSAATGSHVTCEQAHMRVNFDGVARPEPMSDQHEVNKAAVIGDGMQHTLSEEESSIHVGELERSAS
jgi:hypothetical protein